MKKILFIGIILLGVFLIYLSTLDKKVYFLSLGDELSQGYNEFNIKDYGYNDYIKEYLENKSILETYIDNFFEENLRTTDLIRYINDNKKVLINGKNKSIKNALIKADLLTVSIGNNDIINKLSLYKHYDEKELYEYIDSFLSDLEQLFILLKQYCKETIVFIGYYNFLGNNELDKYFDYINKKVSKLCEKYEIRYVDLSKENMNEGNKINMLYPSKSGYIRIGKKIKTIINEEILRD